MNVVIKNTKCENLIMYILGSFSGGSSFVDNDLKTIGRSPLREFNILR